MSTIYNFNEELPSLGGGPAIGDILPVYNVSSGRTKQITISQSRYKTVTATTVVAAGSSFGSVVGTTSTSGFFSPNEGYVNIQATSSGGMIVATPTAAGQEVVICSPNPKSTGIFQIQVSSTYGASSPSFDGTNTILAIPSTLAWGVTLVSLSTTKWGIAATSNALSTTNTTNWSLSTGS
jgi:hypothetical protein